MSDNGAIVYVLPDKEETRSPLEAARWWLAADRPSGPAPTLMAEIRSAEPEASLTMLADPRSLLAMARAGAGIAPARIATAADKPRVLTTARQGTAPLTRLQTTASGAPAGATQARPQRTIRSSSPRRTGSWPGFPAANSPMKDTGSEPPEPGRASRNLLYCPASEGPGDTQATGKRPKHSEVNFRHLPRPRQCPQPSR